MVVKRHKNDIHSTLKDRVKLGCMKNVENVFKQLENCSLELLKQNKFRFSDECLARLEEWRIFDHRTIVRDATECGLKKQDAIGGKRRKPITVADKMKIAIHGIV